jgi:hypothetical protein
MKKPDVEKVYKDLKVGLDFFSKIFKEIKKEDFALRSPSSSLNFY